MKAEKNSKKDKKSGGISPIAAAFAAGAATGLALGAFIASDKGKGVRDKITGLISNFSGFGSNNSDR